MITRIAGEGARPAAGIIGLNDPEMRAASLRYSAGVSQSPVVMSSPGTGIGRFM